VFLASDCEDVLTRVLALRAGGSDLTAPWSVRPDELSSTSAPRCSTERVGPMPWPAWIAATGEAVDAYPDEVDLDR
jgi:hypothetical protein